VTLETVRVEGYECARLDDGNSALTITVSTGPRVLELRARGENLLALVPDATVPVSGGGRLRLLGGHRLWVAPEVPAITYQPDDRPCQAIEVEDGVRVTAPPDGAGLTKSLEVRRAADGWNVDHEIRNDSHEAMELAPWAVTMLRPGGEAVLAAAAGGEGLQADRAIVLWPYTDPADARVSIERDALRVRCAPGPTLKLGVASLDGRATYSLNGETFEKRTVVERGARYADRGAAVQLYVSDAFCEVETLGPLATVEPGGAVAHRERWRLW